MTRKLGQINYLKKDIHPLQIPILLPRLACATIVLLCHSTAMLIGAGRHTHNRRWSPLSSPLSLGAGRGFFPSIPPGPDSLTRKKLASRLQAAPLGAGRGFFPSIPPGPDSLTRKELASRLQAALGHFASLPFGHPSLVNFTATNTPAMALLRGRLPGLLLSRVRLQLSSIKGAGSGVFACRPLLRGELLTLFPGDALLVRDSDEGEIGGVLYSAGYAPPDLCGDASRAYELRISETVSAVGDPEKTTDGAYLGHMCNDAWKLAGRGAEAEEEYRERSGRGANAIFELFLEGSHVGVVATRNIGRGEEVYISYTGGYWLSRMQI